MFEFKDLVICDDGEVNTINTSPPVKAKSISEAVNLEIKMIPW